MRVSVDYEKCSGHGMCFFETPEVYTLGDDGYNNTPPGEVPEKLHELAARGAQQCPEGAIQLIE